MTVRGLARCALAIVLLACTRDPPLVAGRTDSYDFAAHVRGAIPMGSSESNAAAQLSGQGFGCVHSDTLQSDEADTLETNAQPDDPGTEFLTCDYVRPRRWGQSTQRRYLVVLYLREHRVRRVFAVTHLLEVH